MARGAGVSMGRARHRQGHDARQVDRAWGHHAAPPRGDIGVLCVLWTAPQARVRRSSAEASAAHIRGPNNIGLAQVSETLRRNRPIWRIVCRALLDERAPSNESHSTARTAMLGACGAICSTKIKDITEYAISGKFAACLARI